MKTVGDNRSKPHDWEPLESVFQSIIPAVRKLPDGLLADFSDAFEKADSAILLAAQKILASHNLPNVDMSLALLGRIGGFRC